MSVLIDRVASYALPFAMPGLVAFGAFRQQGWLGVILGAIAGGWLVENWIQAGHSLYVMRDQQNMEPDRDW